MPSEQRSTPTTLGETDVSDVSIEEKSPGKQIVEQAVGRWRSWIVAAVTAVTTYYLHSIDGAWSKDAIAFGLFTALILAYTLFTLYSDAKLE